MKYLVMMMGLGLISCMPAANIPEQHQAIIVQTFQEAKILYGIADNSIDLPEIKLADPGKWSYLCRETRRDCEVMAYFDNGTIVLDHEWSSIEPEEVGYLVHAFIHYFQWKENRSLEHGACVNNYDIETQAYVLQSQWLEQKGLPGLSRDNIDNSILATLRC